MAAIQTVITITHGTEVIQTIKDKLLRQSAKPKEECIALSGFFNAFAGGDRVGKHTVQVNSGDAVTASGTITFASFAATNTFTIGKTTVTCVASGATGAQFNVGGTDTLSAAAAVVLINSLPALQTVCTATSVGAVITVVSKPAGLVGNNIPLAISVNGSVSGAFLASGLDALTYTATNTYRSGR